MTAYEGSGKTSLDITMYELWELLIAFMKENNVHFFLLFFNKYPSASTMVGEFVDD